RRLRAHAGRAAHDAQDLEERRLRPGRGRGDAPHRRAEDAARRHRRSRGGAASAPGAGGAAAEAVRSPRETAALNTRSGARRAEGALPEQPLPYERLIECRACPRLARHLDAVAARYPGYYCRPVRPRGPRDARLLIVGLAPGMHGANRTGRPFAGDASGTFLFDALARAGLAPS